MTYKKACDYLKELPTGKEKSKTWERIMQKRQLFFEQEYKRIDSNIKIPAKDKEIICNQILKIAAMELQGGKCIKCDREWVKVEFNNVFGSGEFYQPQCDCLIKCPRCKNQLYDYNVTTRLKMNGYKCPHCGWLLYEDGTPNSKPRFGKAYEIYYDNLKRKPANKKIEKQENNKE